jgi:ketosteroid isomerase-like protein
MKKYFVLFITIALLASACCNEKIDTDKEKEAIIGVIKGITKSHAAGDWDTWLSLWLNEPYIFLSYTSADGYSFIKGWDEFNDMFKEEASEENAENPQPKTTLEPHDFFIRVFKDCAWAEYKIKWTSQMEGSNEIEEWETHENYSFEKRDGVWKVATVSAVNTSSFEKKTEESEEMGEEAEEDEGMEEETE